MASNAKDDDEISIPISLSKEPTFTPFGGTKAVNPIEFDVKPPKNWKISGCV